MLDKELLEIAISDGVNSCHNNILNLSILGELIKRVLVDQVHPVLPLILLREINVVIDKTTVESAWEYFLLKLDFHCIKLTIADFLELLIERTTVLCVN